MNLEGKSVKELREIKDRIDRVMPKAVAKAREDLMAKIQSDAEKVGLTVREVLGGMGRPGKRPTFGTPKYVNQKNPAQTWSGRGRPPHWLTPEMRK